jgi:polysaccharide pyruvyl transferase WcaK-like protein
MEMPERAKTGAVGVQLRGFKTMNDEFLKCLASAITKHFPGRKVEIYSLQDALDLEVCRKFQKLLNQPSTINHQLSIQETIDHIAQNEYMIAMRFHALLAALKSGVKPMAIDYDIKVRQLAQCNGLPMIELQPAADDDEKFEQLKRLEIKPLKSVFDWAGFENYAFW